MGKRTAREVFTAIIVHGTSEPGVLRVPGTKLGKDAEDRFKVTGNEHRIDDKIFRSASGK